MMEKATLWVLVVLLSLCLSLNAPFCTNKDVGKPDAFGRRIEYVSVFNSSWDLCCSYTSFRDVRAHLFQII